MEMQLLLLTSGVFQKQVEKNNVRERGLMLLMLTTNGSFAAGGYLPALALLFPLKKLFLKLLLSVTII